MLVPPTVLRSAALVLLIPAVLLGLDFGLRHADMSTWSWVRWSAYALALGVDVLCYLVAFAVTRHLWWRSHRAALVVTSLGASLLSAWVVSAFVYYGVFHCYPTWSDLVFLTEEGGHFEETWGLFSSFFEARVFIGFGVSLACTFTLWRLALQRAAAVPARRRMSAALGLCACLVLLPLTNMTDSVAISPTGSLPISSARLVRYYWLRTKGNLHERKEQPLPPLTASGRPVNVLLLLQESLTRSRMDLYGYREPTMPGLTRWVREHAQSTVLFTDATANASNTSISVVTLATGLSPDASTELLHTQPFVWQLARAAGYHTFLRSAQSFHYANFRTYFLSTPPDDVWTAEKGTVPMANGGGMDDELYIPRLHEAIDRARASGKPFFGVVQFNSTHFPYLSKPERKMPFDTTDKLGRYQNAMRLLDGVLTPWLQRLKAQGLLEDTLIVLTSDHGENHDGHEPHRTQSYYEDVTGIQLWVYVPPALAAQRPELLSQLRANSSGRVQNLDVLPTLLDGMGVLHDPALAPYAKHFGGQSLFSNIAPDRAVLVMNNNAVRTWVNEGFAIARARTKYVFSERYGEALYELDRDPQEQRNQWDPRRRPAWVDQTLREHPELCALRSRHCNPRAGCVPIPCGAPKHH
jgi:glucan phosphoethanolaminetransferase (alkaline phosphatase superfamily)